MPNSTIIQNDAIRKEWNAKDSRWHFSIVDIIGIVTDSADARNYWKTLKNRLKSTQNQLVTKCNQLKMKASDGKMYLTDATDSDTMLLLIQSIAPGKVGEFRRIFRKIEEESSPLSSSQSISAGELSTALDEDYELSIDMHKDKDIIVIRAMLAGVEPNDISIIATCKNITIKSHRTRQDLVPNYQIEELPWGKFSREIILPLEINIDEVETNFSHGLLEIKISKIDKARTRIIKIK